MKSEATMTARNGGFRAPLETSTGPDATGGARSAPSARADDARSRSGSSGPAARPFEESMTQAMRRTQSRPANEAREIEEVRARDDESVATNETKDAGSEAAAGLALTVTGLRVTSSRATALSETAAASNAARQNARTDPLTSPQPSMCDRNGRSLLYFL